MAGFGLIGIFYSRPPAFWTWRSIPFMPGIALLYSLAAFIFLAMFHEIEWFDHSKQLGLRIFAFSMTLLVSWAVVQSGLPNQYTTVPITTWTTLLGMLLIQRTRVEDVEGGPPPKLPKFSMRGKVVLVTGANSGIGYETTLQLVAEGAIVVMGCRSEDRAKEAMATIQDYHFRRRHLIIDDSQLLFIPIDMADFSSIRRAVTKFLEMDLPLHVLVNNAGVMNARKVVTKEGYEQMMQVNHLAPFLLTKLLLPKLQETCGRVLNVSSCTYVIAARHGGMDFEDMFCDKGRQFSYFGQYSHSKIANILFTKSLAKRFDNKIRSYAIHPGIVRTNVTSNAPWILWFLDVTVGPFTTAFLQREPRQGAHTIVWSACCPVTELPPNGSYLVNSKVKPLRYKEAFADEHVDKLWAISENLITSKASKAS